MLLQITPIKSHGGRAKKTLFRFDPLILGPSSKEKDASRVGLAGVWVKESRPGRGKWSIRIKHGDGCRDRVEYRPAKKQDEGDTGGRNVDREEGNNQAGRKEEKGDVDEKGENGYDLWYFVL